MVTDERPHSSARVVPGEPSLRLRYYLLTAGVVMLLIFVAGAILSWRGMQENDPFRVFPIFWKYSLPGNVSSLGTIGAAICAFPLSRWRKLNQRRQQAARYNLAVDVQERALIQPQADGPALPDSFVLSAERSWQATFIPALLCLVLLSIGAAGAWSDWQGTFPLVQQGVSVALVLLNTGLNLALLLALAGGLSGVLICAPRQQLIVTSDSLTWRRGWHTRSICWQEACLFALIDQFDAHKQKTVRFYELASNDTIIRWPSTNRMVSLHSFMKIPAGVALLNQGVHRAGPETASFELQIEFLNSIVTERTRLPLYDLC